MSSPTPKLTPWSISKGQIAHGCTLRFSLQYIEKAQKQKIERSEGRVGAAAHLFVEYCLQGDDYKVAYQKAVVDQRLTRNETLQLATFKDAVLRFIDRFATWRDKMNVADDEFFIEKEVAFDKDKNLTGYWDSETFFRGKWDIGALVRRSGKLYVIIIDHKTGVPKDNLERYQDQLWSYVASAKILYPELAGAQPAVHWMRADDPDDSIVWGPMISARRIEDDIMPWFWEYFEEASSKGLDTPVPKKDWYCDFCPFRYRCPLFATKTQ